MAASNPALEQPRLRVGGVFAQHAIIDAIVDRASHLSEVLALPHLTRAILHHAQSKRAVVSSRPSPSVYTKVVFDWDPTKAANDLKDHGVSFEEAATAFMDLMGLDAPDPTHSDDEDRFLRIGLSNTGAMLLVSYTVRPSG